MRFNARCRTQVPAIRLAREIFLNSGFEGIPGPSSGLVHFAAIGKANALDKDAGNGVSANLQDEA
jgi:hypothetical protein